MAHFLPPEHVRQVNKLEWPYHSKKLTREGYRQIHDCILGSSYFSESAPFETKSKSNLIYIIKVL